MTLDHSNAGGDEVLQPDTPPVEDTMAASGMEPTQTKPGRGGDGKFLPKAGKERGVDFGVLARNEVRSELAKEKARLAEETDISALDTVKPKGKGKGVPADPAPESVEATKGSKPEHPSPENTHAAKHLADAHKALELDGFSKEDLAGLKPERILALGKAAKERQADVSRKLEEAAKAKTAQAPSQAAKTDGGSSKPAATTKPADDGGDDDFETLVREHFDGFDDPDGHFSKSLGGLSKALASKLDGKFSAQFEAMKASLAEEIGSRLANEVAFERAVDRYKADFPQLDTPDGREALVPILASMAKDGLVKDVPSGVKAAAYALWGEAREREQAESAKSKNHRDARKNGQPVTGSMGSAPKPQSFDDSVRAEIRKAMESQGR